MHNLGPAILSLAEVPDLCQGPVYFNPRTITFRHGSTIELVLTIRITIGSKPSPLVPDNFFLRLGWPLGFSIIAVFVFRKRPHEPRLAAFFESDNITSRDVQVFEVFQRDFVQYVRAITMLK
jgi:hypothetical protein